MCCLYLLDHLLQLTAKFRGISSEPMMGGTQHECRPSRRNPQRGVCVAPDLHEEVWTKTDLDTSIRRDLDSLFVLSLPNGDFDEVTVTRDRWRGRIGLRHGAPGVVKQTGIDEGFLHACLGLKIRIG